MSTFSDTTRTANDDRLAAAATTDQAGGGLRRWLSLLAAVAALAWSGVELVGLVLNHTAGPELYGVLVAALAVAAGTMSSLLLAAGKRRLWWTGATLALWLVVAIGGVGGTVAHIVGPAPGHGSIDPRERPIAAPLVFTGIGLVGGAALFYGQRKGIRDALNRWKG